MMFCCVSFKGKKSPPHTPGQPSRVKVTVVGDGGCGKTSLVQRFCAGTLPREYCPTIFECMSVNAAIGRQQVQLVIQDTSGQEDLDRMRPPQYLNTDVVVVCFALDDPDSLHHVQSKWVPEARRCCGRQVPILLVATKADTCHNSAGQCRCLKADGRSSNCSCCIVETNLKRRRRWGSRSNGQAAADAKARLKEYSSVLEARLDPSSASFLPKDVSGDLRGVTSALSGVQPERASCETCDAADDLDRPRFSFSLSQRHQHHHHHHHHHHHQHQNLSFCSAGKRRNSKALSASTRCLVLAPESKDWDQLGTESRGGGELIAAVGSSSSSSSSSREAPSNPLADVGRLVAQDVSAAGYCVTSATLGVGVAEVFRSAMEAAMGCKQWKKKFACR